MLDRDTVLSKVDSLDEELSNVLNDKLSTGDAPGAADKLRHQLSMTQTYTFRLSQIKRDMEVISIREKRTALEKLKADEEYVKANVSEKKIMLDDEIAEVKARMKHLERIEEILNNRCTTAQSLLKSMNYEEKAHAIPTKQYVKPVSNNPFENPFD